MSGDDPGVPSWMVDENTDTGGGGDVETPASSTTSQQKQNERQPQPVISEPMEISTPTISSGSPSSDMLKTNANTGGTNTTSAAESAQAKTWNEYFMESFQRDGRLFLITLVIIICMNIPYIKYLMYPLNIFCTWIHELCHGLAAVLAGGSISKLLIFPDTSGLAYTAVPADRRGFVASAGYQGTAVIGCLLLIFRRTKRGPRSGTMALACTMMLSVMLWIRNIFGGFFIFFMGLILAIAAWFLPSTRIRNLYIGLAVTVSLNAITSVQNLFGSNHMVNGEPTSTDAHTMGELKGGGYALWATLWFFLAIILTIVGVLFAIPGPDEVADFTCCGVCQDFGLFKLCNYPGLRLTRRLRQSMNNNNASTTATSVNGE